MPNKRQQPSEKNRASPPLLPRMVLENSLVGALAGGAVGVLLRIYLARLGFHDLDWGIFLFAGLAVGFFSGFERIKVERLRREKRYLEAQLAQAGEALRSVREKHRALMERTTDVIFRADRRGRVIESNRSLAELLLPGGAGEENGFLPDLFPHHLQGLLREALAQTLGGEAKVLEIEIQAVPNQSRFFSLVLFPDRGADGAVGGVSGIIREISDRKRLEQSLARAEKLAALGTMAACVAHELRNPLGVIRTAAYNLERRLTEKNEKTAKHLAHIAEKIEEADKIILSLLNFSRLRKPSPVETDLNRLIEETASQVAEGFPSLMVSVVKKLHPLPPLHLDRGQMAEVFQNLIKNAYEAMPEGGTLTLTSEARGLEGKAVLTVADTGCGIPPAALAQISTPFFSLKTRGIGLGLAISYRIVEEVHGGKISVASEEGRGTVFTVELPLR